MLLVCIRSYLKQIPKYKFLISNTNHLDTLHLREQGCEDPCLIFEAKGGPRTKCLEILDDYNRNKNARHETVNLA